MRILNGILVFTFIFWGGAAYSAEDKSVEHDIEDYLGFSLEIPRKTQELIGLKTAKVEASAAGAIISVTGRIAQDIDNVVEVFTPQTGKIKECPTPVGTVVTQGQIVCLIEGHNDQVIEVKAPSEGVIIADYAKAGEAVDLISPLHTIADLSKLSANFDVYEQDIGKIKVGQRVTVSATAFADQSFEGKIIFVSPRVDESSFTTRIRVEINNHNLLLKPGMFVWGEISLENQQANLKIPSSAVQNLEGVDVVFLQDESESFTPTKVNVEFASRNQTFVLGELRDGDVVVTEGSFILKSKILENEIAGGCGDH